MSNNQPKSIVKNQDLKSSLDFNFLKKIGIENIQNLSGNIWTDYNEHDPGVTILENLCFALTELGYKTDFSIEDLFFKKSEERKDFLKTFYGPHELLSIAPITQLDFRKVIIDHVDHVKNAWVEPKKQSTIGTRINGLYEVLLMVDPEIKDKDSVLEHTNQLLQSNRNLGEDFEIIKILEFDKIHFSANIRIAPDAIGEQIYAQIITDIQAYFSPNILLYSSDELLEMGYDHEFIFNYPLVKNGYIIDEDLMNSQLNNLNKVFRSDIIRLITDVEGVQEVLEFQMYLNGDEISNEIIQLDEYKIPLLDYDKIIDKSTISLVAGDIAYSPDKEVVRYTYEIDKSKYSIKHSRYIEKDEISIESDLTKEEIEQYHSIQNSFPRTYGITDFGIQGKVSESREAQVKQLRAYLFFFEQILANYLSQLANVEVLFSTNPNLESTYFFQHLNYLNGFDEIIKSYNGTGDLPLLKINNKFDRVEERRNRMLDHMLSRFGEEFLMEAYNAIHRESSSVAKENFLEQSINAKCLFLNNYIDISRNKAKGYNHYSDYTDSENVSGLEKKISLLFNLVDYGFKRLSDLTSEKSLNMTDKKENNTKTKVSFNSDNENLLADLLAFGIDRNNYKIEKKDKKYELSFNNPIDNEELVIYSAASIKECEDATSSLIEKLNQYNQISEGFHIIEHILLRDIDSSFRFIYISESNIELSSPYDYSDSKTDRKNFIENLLEIGSVKANYSVKKTGDFYKIVLSKKGSPFQVTSQELMEKATATEAIDDFIAEFKATKATDADMDLRLHLDQDMSNVSTYNEDPYSLQISFVCPNWSGRFRSDKMKYLFENVVKLNSPAHLKINFFWISLDEMKEFEDYYEKWLQGKNDTKFSRRKLDKLSKVLLLLLQTYDHSAVDKKLAKELNDAKSAVK